jgi:hypothetical protein
LAPSIYPRQLKLLSPIRVTFDRLRAAARCRLYPRKRTPVTGRSFDLSPRIQCHREPGSCVGCSAPSPGTYRPRTSSSPKTAADVCPQFAHPQAVFVRRHLRPMCRDQADVPGVDIAFRRLGSDGPGGFRRPGNRGGRDAACGRRPGGRQQETAATKRLSWRSKSSWAMTGVYQSQTVAGDV